MRDYGKVYSTFWSSETTGGLSDDAKLLALYLLTCSHSTIAGVFRLPDGYVSEDLHWTGERVAQGFAELFQKGFANRCETTKWVWVKKHLEWNKPENPNQRKAAAKVATSVPDQCGWKRAFWSDAAEVLTLEPLPPANPSGTVPQTVEEGFRNQKQEQKQEQEYQGATAPSSPASQPTPASPPASAAPPSPPPAPPAPPAPPRTQLDLDGGEIPAGPPPCPVKQLVGMFVAKVPEMPKPRFEMWKDSAGAEAMRQRWKWLLSPDAVRDDNSRYATTAAEAVEWFGRFFDVVAASDFLTGRKDGRSKFDLSWLMKRENFLKVVQGNYSSERP